MNIKHIKQIILTFLSLTALIVYISIWPQVISAEPYGRCTYGSHLYNGQCVSSNSGSSGSSGSSSSSSAGGSGGSTCNSQAPGSAPNLFQINTVGTSAILYFAPSLHPYSNYYVSFGDGTKDEGYGAEFALSQTTGALKYDVYKLKPNTRYTFKVRAGNGCMAGPWSSTLAVKTGAKNSKYVNKFYPFKQAYFTKSVWSRINGVWTSILKLFPR